MSQHANFIINQIDDLAHRLVQDHGYSPTEILEAFEEYIELYAFVEDAANI
jgi:hypothetical protein